MVEKMAGIRRYGKKAVALTLSAAVLLGGGILIQSALAANSDIVCASSFTSAIYDELLENWDANGDDKLSQSELSAVTSLDLSGMRLSSLRGVEYLTNLTKLDASDNRLTSVNYINECVNLKYLDLSSNKISSLTGLS